MTGKLHKNAYNMLGCILFWDCTGLFSWAFLFLAMYSHQQLLLATTALKKPCSKLYWKRKNTLSFIWNLKVSWRGSGGSWPRVLHPQHGGVNRTVSQRKQSNGRHVDLTWLWRLLKWPLQTSFLFKMSQVDQGDGEVTVELIGFF